jgi:hypothetical protein
MVLYASSFLICDYPPKSAAELLDSLEQNRLGRGQAVSSGTDSSDPERAPADLLLIDLSRKLQAGIPNATRATEFNDDGVSGGALGATYVSPARRRLPPSRLVLC